MGGFGQRFSNLAGIDIDREQPDAAGMDFSNLSPEMRAHIMQRLAAKRQQRAPAPPQFQDPFARGAEQVASGWKQLWAPSDTTAADPAWWKSKQEAAADVVEGASPFMAPAALIGVAAAPVAGLLELGAGTAAGMGSEYLAEKAGVPSGASKLVGAMASIPGGAMAGATGLTAEDLVSGARRVGRGVKAAQDAFDRIAYPGSELHPEAGVLYIGGKKPRGTLKREPTERPAEATSPGRSAVAGGLGGELSAAAEKPVAAPVTQKRPAGNSELQRVTNEYNAQRGLPPIDHSQYHPLDEQFGRRVADAYDALKEDNSADPRVRAAYEALAKETKEQYDHLVKNGYKFEPWQGEGQPYANSHEMVADLRDNKHLYFFTGGEPHPFMGQVDPDTGLTYNELFRAVHDAWAHGGAGYGFGPRGEEGAHDIHSQSFSPLAQQAMTTETRGQNSWVNFGRHNYNPEGKLLAIPAAEKPFAQQKVDLLPEEFHQPAGERYRAAAEAPAKVRDVKARTIGDLERRIPHAVRAVSKDPTRTIDGKFFHDLDLDAPGEGFHPMAKYGEKQADDMVMAAWEQSIDESEMAGGTAAREAVKKTGAAPRGASFWDKAFRQPKRGRFWYELSGESFTGRHFNVPRDMQPLVIDAFSGTSGGVEPGPNAKRAIGILSEDLQKVPVMTDLRDPVSARNALARLKEGLRSLKYRSFGGTMKYTTGLSTERPLTTNDVQVASMFGIKGTDIGSNPVLYEVLSRFFLKMRDMQNAHIAPGAQPWETWQMQAPAWVYERALKNPAKAAEYDDYSLVLPKIIQQLARAGVPTPGGKITLETLLDPRTPNLMSGTRERFLKTPVATMEVATRLTPEGAAAADLYQQIGQLDADEPWVRKAKKSYQQIQRNMMGALMKRKGGNKELGIRPEPSVLSQLASVIAGRPVDVSRIDRTGLGVFQGELNPNMRIPLVGRASQKWISLNPVEREAMLAILGEDTQQEAMAASLFESVAKQARADTYSVFLRRYDGVIDQDAITAFSNQLGHSVNVSQAPNGVVIDVNMEVPKGAPRYGPTEEAVQAAAKAAFGSDPDVEEIGYFGRNYDSHYVPKEEYRGKIDAWKKSQRAAAGTAETGPGGARRAGDPAQRAGDLARVRKTIRTHARVRDRASTKWTADTRARLQKHLAKAPPAGAEP